MVLAVLVGGALGGASLRDGRVRSVPADRRFWRARCNRRPLTLSADGSDAAPVVCPDAGYYYITINGDGDAQTLSSNWGSFPDVSVPAAFYQPPCAGLFVIAGTEEAGRGHTPVLPNPTAARVSPPAPPEPSHVGVRPSRRHLFLTQRLISHTTDLHGARRSWRLRGRQLRRHRRPAPDAASLSLSGTFCTLRLPDGPSAQLPPVSVH